MSRSSWNFSRPFSVFSPKTVRVRLYSPAVSTSKSMSCFFSRRLTLGNCATTPIDPSTANGALTIFSPMQAIMYPPLAATLSMHTVNGMPAWRIRASCDAAKP
ncbi:hypothetical protein D3C76_1434250 [compost metagenome]